MPSASILDGSNNGCDVGARNRVPTAGIKDVHKSCVCRLSQEINFGNAFSHRSSTERV